MKPIQSLPSAAYRVTLSPAACSLDLGDGSERGEYVDQDTVLQTLGRPHRAVNLMYCYYPFDKKWPLRASVAYKNKSHFTWGHPYDDYFPFTGGPKGDTRGPVFQQMRDIRRHGQDVNLTLTMDCAVPDDHIRVIARQLKPYGRMRIRLNHECDGTWFAFNRNYTHAEVGEFFVRFAKVLTQEAPAISLVSCWGHKENSESPELRHEKELAPQLEAAGVWSTDKYITLDWSWPYKACEPGGKDKTYFVGSVKTVWKQTASIHRRFVELSGLDKGIEIGEFNADGNIGGEAAQLKMVGDFYRKILKEKPGILKGVTFYQFRDRGRLGLEREDPNNPQNGLSTPLIPFYREMLRNPYFQPKETWTKAKGLSMEWRASDDSDGLGWKIALKKKPVFLELQFGKKANLMVRAGTRWFYKKPGVEWVDATAAAVDWGTRKPFPVVVFAPPTDGTNPKGATAVRTKFSKPPKIRLLADWKD